MRTKKRLTKRISKQELKRDRFVDATFNWALWARENVRVVAIGAGVVVLVLAAVLFLRSSQARESRAAGDRFQEIWQAYLAGNFQLAANDFKQFLRQYRDSEYADEASLYLGDSYLQAGNHAAAIKTLEDFDDSYGDSPLAYAAVNLRAAAYEASGNLAKAAELYEEAEGRARYDYQRVASLMAQARIYAAQQATNKAAGAYRKILEKYPDSASVGEARVRLAELTTKPLITTAGSASRSSDSETSSPQAVSTLEKPPAAQPSAAASSTDAADLGTRPPIEVITGSAAKDPAARAQESVVPKAPAEKSD